MQHNAIDKIARRAKVAPFSQRVWLSSADKLGVQKVAFALGLSSLEMRMIVHHSCTTMVAVTPTACRARWYKPVSASAAQIE
jgi:hypothetical protein